MNEEQGKEYVEKLGWLRIKIVTGMYFLVPSELLSPSSSLYFTIPFRIPYPIYLLSEDPISGAFFAHRNPQKEFFFA